MMFRSARTVSALERMILLSVTTEGTEFVASCATLRLIPTICRMARPPSRREMPTIVAKPIAILRGVEATLESMRETC